MAPQAHLVLIETAGNQAYIFGTNRLREQVGASELIRRIGTEYVLNAVGTVSDRPGLYADRPADLAENLLNVEKNPPFGTAGGPGVEVIVATSGKALLLVDGRDRGEAIVAGVTERTLREAPGAVVRGFVSEPFPFQDADRLHRTVKDVHQGIEGLRRDLPAPQARFPTLPILEPCKSSSLPASRIKIVGDDDPDADDRSGTFSAPILAKQEARLDSWSRFQSWERTHNCVLARDIERLEKLKCDWLAYVHADGNGLGKIFLDFQALRPDSERKNDAAAYISDYRKFSLAIEACTETAFVSALQAFKTRWDPRKKRHVLPVAPLILGGDDLTVVCDGGAALKFAAEYLQNFEWETANNQRFGTILQDIARAGEFGSPGLAACAGIAVVKPHFPAHRAYDLAEALTKSAKHVKERVKRCSALDFHVHFDSSGADLDAIRALSVVDRRDDTTPKTRTEPTAKPYVVTHRDLLAGLSKESDRWLRKRHWTDLRAIAADLTKPTGQDERDVALPRNQQHYLREGIFLGKATADARMNQIRHRYPDFGWKRLLHPPKASDHEQDSLFFMEIEKTVTGDAAEVTRTRLLDALELAELEGGASDDR